MVPEGWYLVQHCATVVEPGTKGRPKVGVPVPRLYESVPINISSIDVLQFLEQILAFNSAYIDTDATVTWSGVVWSCPLVSQGTDVDLLSEFVIFMINCTILIISYKLLPPKSGDTDTFNLGGTWYLMSWYRYQRRYIKNLK